MEKDNSQIHRHKNQGGKPGAAIAGLSIGHAFKRHWNSSGGVTYTLADFTFAAALLMPPEGARLGSVKHYIFQTIREDSARRGKRGVVFKGFVITASRFTMSLERMSRDECDGVYKRIAV